MLLIVGQAELSSEKAKNSGGVEILKFKSLKEP